MIEKATNRTKIISRPAMSMGNPETLANMSLPRSSIVERREACKVSIITFLTIFITHII